MFAAWLLGEVQKDAEFISIVERAAVHDGAQQTFQAVAILGFAAHAGVLARKQVEAFKKGLRRHAGREPVVEGVPLAFMSDVVGIFGIAIGATAIADVEIIGHLGRWSGKFLRDVYEMDRTEDWERCLLAVADRQLQPTPGLSVPGSAAVSDVRVALAGKGLIVAADIPDPGEDELRAMVLEYQEPATQLDYDRAALRTAAVAVVIASLDRRLRSPETPPLNGAIGTRSSGVRVRRSPPLITERTSEGARVAKEARAATVARIVKELNVLRPQMFEDESEYQRLRDQYPDFLTFKIADERPDLKTKVLAIQGSTRHIRLAQELAGAHHERTLATIRDDWKDFKPAEFKRVY